ncbi:prepilin-type N-terminal cleavage/methylation domain-containing protein [Paraconexibacter antarcticus]|uniref:Prepilin-type N-terminal cleavage/methylation domain-containing protein n=1 Tax=Paraconexibacter antarcticus TaxID=2949664 RepID=A0ABY5DV07_9ACTN|nr:prepilin-type N-terminal cleavage/methylation domain-containing protein [Paraconexibacter antarcticus]UTI64359.1 prepilin-type N-terminal cleavage/methylation domain-containing protein [Paraconexibacter antarcticus]UTI66789.1 prepilin-type N-terminal cleavage/methylation domain-containing protein [Paraconexibacter antarcticus]
MTLHPPPAPHPPSTRRRDEAGFTLVELLVTMLVGVVILFAVLSLLDGSAVHELAVAGRVAGTDDADQTIARIGDDVRQSFAVAPWTSSPTTPSDTLDLQVLTRQSDGAIALHTIRWDCAAPAGAATWACVRRDLTAGTADQPAPGQFTVSGVSAFTVLAPVSGAGGLPSVRVRLSAPIASRPATVDFDTTFVPRNCQTIPLTVGSDCPWP